MELSAKQQIVEAIKNSQELLVLSHVNPDGDCVGSLLAFAMAMKKMGKNAQIVLQDPVPKIFNFLPDSNKIKNEITGTRDFIISLDVSETKAEKFLYKIEDGKINFIVTPKDGQFSESAVSFPGGKFRYDLIVVLDCPDIERVGKFYADNADLFYETPIANIDHHAGNDHFGKINLVELTATSTCEILVSIFEALAKDTSLLTADVATALLTGIITDTGSFQNASTTPKSLTVAAQLVAAGAEQQEIIKNIFKTRPLSTLRLWGRVLSNIHEEKNYRFVWSKVTKLDFLETNSGVDESSGVIDELLKTASGVDFVLLLSERNDGLHGSLRAVLKSCDVSAIAKMFGGGGHAMAAAFNIPKNGSGDVTDSILAKIRIFQEENGQAEDLQKEG